MQKISCNEALEHEEFELANNFIKQNVEKIASEIHTTDDIEQRILNHYDMVAQISRFYLFVIESFTENDLKELNNEKGNLKKLNRLLALRQLCEKQLTGVMNGAWGLKKEVIESDNFKRKVGLSKINITKEDIYKAIA